MVTLEGTDSLLVAEVVCPPAPKSLTGEKALSGRV